MTCRVGGEYLTPTQENLLTQAKTLQGRKERTRPQPKEDLLENFDGLQEPSRPVVDTTSLQEAGNLHLPPNPLLCGPALLAKQS